MGVNVSNRAKSSYSKSQSFDSTFHSKAFSCFAPQLTLSDDAKDCLAKHFHKTLMQQIPDVFHRAMIESMQKSCSLNEVVACQRYCRRDLAQWTRLNVLCQAQLNFYDRLIYTLKLNKDACAEAVNALGAIHYRYAKYGFKPHFLDIWQKQLQTIVEQTEFPSNEEQKLFLESFHELNTYITDVMNIALSRCQMESILARRHTINDFSTKDY